jgi:hypothetical protein
MSDIAGKMAEWRKTLWGTGPCQDSLKENFTLTDEEWEAVWLAIGMFAEGPEHIKRHEEMADALRGLLERLGGAK